MLIINNKATICSYGGEGYGMYLYTSVCVSTCAQAPSSQGRDQIGKHSDISLRCVSETPASSAESGCTLNDSERLWAPWKEVGDYEDTRAYSLT